MRRRTALAAAAAGAALALSGTSPAAAQSDPVEIWGFIALWGPGDEYSSRLFVASDVVVGDGPELTGADLLDEHGEMCGDLLVDIDPVDNRTTVSADAEVGPVTFVGVEITTDEIDLVLLGTDNLFSAGVEGVTTSRGVDLVEGSDVSYTWEVNGSPLVMDGEAFWWHQLNDREAVEDYVDQVYLDLFDRPTDPEGLDAWADALQAGTPYAAVANGITYSDEYRATMIRGAYLAYLGREPDPSGAAGWLAAMRLNATIQQMEAGFIASEEYYARSGGTDSGWVRELYTDVLGRAAGDAEVRAWTDALAGGGTRHQVAMGFLTSYEHLTDVVDGHYQHLLGRGIDPDGAHSWVITIQNGARVEAVIAGIVASDEYRAKVPTD